MATQRSNSPPVKFDWQVLPQILLMKLRNRITADVEAVAQGKFTKVYYVGIQKNL